ncbi:MAG: hypothetical protein WC852_06740 [Candidatus Nanoarchaeia archaeon]|jgi:coenzyme F420-reducing hydrogenase gamma subunit
MQKKKVGVFSFTCCEGCSIVFIELLNKRFFEYRDEMQIDNFRALKKSDKIGKLDLAIIEGAISTASEKNKLLKIRKNAKTIMAIGSCANTGMPSSQRNFFDEEKKKKIQPLLEKLHQLKTIEPLKKYVKVDIQVNGCPISRNELDDKIEQYLKQVK